MIVLVSLVSHTNAFIIMSTNFKNLINVALLLVHKSSLYFMILGRV